MPKTGGSSLTRGAYCAGTQQMRRCAQRHKGVLRCTEGRKTEKESERRTMTVLKKRERNKEGGREECGCSSKNSPREHYVLKGG